jgi:hypothetical protein
MNLESKFFLNHFAYGSSDFLCERLEYLLFVVINSDMRRLQMLNVNQHLEWVGQCHREKVELVQSHLILSNTLEKSWE